MEKHRLKQTKRLNGAPSKVPIKIAQMMVAGVVAVSGAGAAVRNLGGAALAMDCPDVKFVFARGSGAERWSDQNFLAFRGAIESDMSRVDMRYEIEDLDYPAVGVGGPMILLGAYVGAGDSYEFGASVDGGVEALIQMVNHGACANTKYVLGGYSQGAMVVSKALASLDAEKVIYAATFGDPKIYLPEGKAEFSIPLGTSEKNFLRTGVIPDACRGNNLSDYREYVPDCYAYEGLLGSYQPYEPAAYLGKVGTWCNTYDVFCSSYFSVSSHTSYVADNLYEDAGRVIFDKVMAYFGREERHKTKHDTAILLDTTKSMSEMIGKYRAEAIRLAKETFDSGGRVALYDYRDLSYGYRPVEHCGFETCTLEIIEEELRQLQIQEFYNNDVPESTLSAAYTVMLEQHWEVGVTKSMVILTDAAPLKPDRDGTTEAMVVALSKTIDPVNIYVVTTPGVAHYYELLAENTGGRVAILGSDEAEITDVIIQRNDSLPHVEETTEAAGMPWAEVAFEDAGETGIIHVDGAGESMLVIINDAVLGMREMGDFTVEELDRNIANTVTVVPVGGGRRGARASVEIAVLGNAERDNTEEPGAPAGGQTAAGNRQTVVAGEQTAVPVPKTPNTGVGGWR